ncbi:MAG: hypothetical protein V1773_15735 [bacterium]
MRHFLVSILFLFCSSTLSAQLSVSLNINLGSQPVWGPTGYDYVEYYYLPDVDSYYNVPQQRYYCYEGGSWISRSSLPSRYNYYNIYNSYKVVVNEKEPWKHHKTYRDKYLSYKGRHNQQMIRDCRDEKYFVNKSHPEHNNWLKKHNNSKMQKMNKGYIKEMKKGNNDDKNNNRNKKSGKNKK